MADISKLLKEKNFNQESFIQQSSPSKVGVGGKQDIPDKQKLRELPSKICPPKNVSGRNGRIPGSNLKPYKKNKDLSKYEHMGNDKI